VLHLRHPHPEDQIFDTNQKHAVHNIQQIPATTGHPSNRASGATKINALLNCQVTVVGSRASRKDQANG
jgi:hypothetical protein